MKPVALQQRLELLRANSVVAHYQKVQLSPPELALNQVLVYVLVHLSHYIFGGKELVHLQSPVVGESGGTNN